MPGLCPKCGVTAKAIWLPPKEYPSSAPVLVGGFLLGWIYQFSRKPRWRCSSCSAEFYRHNLVSICFLIPWVLFLIGVGIGVVGLLLEGYRIHKERAASHQLYCIDSADQIHSWFP